MFSTVLANVSVVGVSIGSTAGVPVPLSAAVNVLLVMFVATVNVPVRVPVVVGVNTTFALQVAFSANVPVQVEVTA